MRRLVLLLTALALALVVASGVALAATINGNERDNVLVGTDRADTINGRGGADTIYGRGGADTISGGDGRDTQQGGPGNDRILSAGMLPDVVDCGRGRDDFAEVDPSDTVRNCERVRRLE